MSGQEWIMVTGIGFSVVCFAAAWAYETMVVPVRAALESTEAGLNSTMDENVKHIAEIRELTKRAESDGALICRLKQENAGLREEIESIATASKVKGLRKKEKS